MGSRVLANLRSDEGTLSGEKTIDFGLPMKKVIITNDSGLNNLEYKFNSSESFATLKPTETLSLDEFSTRTVILNGTGPYRVWGFG